MTAGGNKQTATLERHVALYAIQPIRIALRPSILPIVPGTLYLVLRIQHCPGTPEHSHRDSLEIPSPGGSQELFLRLFGDSLENAPDRLPRDSLVPWT